MGVGSKIGSTISKLYIGGLLILLNDDWRWTLRLVSLFGVLGIGVFLGFVFFRLKDDDEVWFAFPYYSKLKEFFNIRTFDSIVELMKSKKDSNASKQAQIADMTNKQLSCRDPREFEVSSNTDMQALKKEVLKEIRFVLFCFVLFLLLSLLFFLIIAIIILLLLFLFRLFLFFVLFF